MSSPGVSSKLAEYMLKGWILTDEICANVDCNVPLMRSPKGSPSTMFCAQCDGDPEGAASGSAITHVLPIHQVSPSLSPSTGTRLSRASTPPTDISSALSSPTFASPIDTTETLRRRQQSDNASAEIGRRLLKGWAMLADECPNSGCYGIPLVRPPVAGGSKDPRKECVTCGTIYVDEKDALGWDRLVPVSQTEPSSRTTTNTRTSDADVVKEASNGFMLPSEGPSRILNKEDKSGKRSVHNHTQSTSTDSIRRNDIIPILDQKNGSANDSVLESAKISLESALGSLSQRLLAQSTNPLSADPSSMGVTAEAMGKVLNSLVQTRNLQTNGGKDE